MKQTTRYSYESIQPGQFRMCRFVQDGDCLSAVLETFSVDGQNPQYNALSYTWGLDQRGPTTSWAIQIGEQYLSALRSRGTLLDGTWWWIDSICIDQKNVHERDEHVRRMKTTYQKAQKVIVWLGEQSDDSECALDFICLLDEMSRARHSNEDVRMSLQKDQYHAQWIALQRFFLRKWWTRIWTIQEFVIPSAITFWCGPRHISIDAIYAALTEADICSSNRFKGTIAFHHAWNRIRAWLLYKFVPRPGLSLLALAAYFCINEATDDRDRLYGLTGLSTEDHALDIDYSCSVDEVYLRFAQSFITQHKSLDIISFASLFIATPGSSLPSWVPDWRTKTEPFVVPLMTSQSSNNFVGNLRPPQALGYSNKSTQYSASGSRVAVYNFEGVTLLAQGCIIDVIDGLAGSRTLKFVQSSGQHAQFSAASCSPKNNLMSVCRSLVLDRKDRYLRFPMPMKQFYHDFIRLCLLLISGSEHPVHKEFEDWFQFTRLLRIHGNSFEEILRDVQNDGTDAFVDTAPNQDEYIQDSFYGRFFDIVERMSLRLMTSCNGRIGMVPQRAIKGDLICVLFGCSVPILLRRTEHKEEFIVIGECFVEKCMEGEALDECKPLERTFHII
ncbi:uncharacterized protein K460DRAFT_422571 [Cucurbitaria berberidis CBS 394.84]|uniref:Heterokaryon incompatibility domain-containing protein n=1 Tax=Cucurbitaria berberidis CBS 394.84 TaxID=1168544 RepID=A0A9P4GR16_9PLEO|nr:uncharacterized protein K460DRAFT_422571 [Cucurbitaria berberidis CBS 394.84]KAF1850140.1 hypothetical protein K460DRAFT_422571 [Cucurbitaria berberidis CBS 394.84]